MLFAGGAPQLHPSSELAPGVAYWSELSPPQWHAILIGNGASRAISERFRYQSLLEVASGQECAHPLTVPDLEYFRRFDTENFEIVLGYLGAALAAAEIYGLDPTTFKEAYQRIRRSLAAAVQSVHPQHEDLGEDRLRSIGAAIREYDWIFTTNYDLLLYWGTLAFDRSGFYDFLLGNSCMFRDAAAQVTPPSARSKVVYLHGALHLFTPLTGEYSGKTLKRTVPSPAQLLAALMADSEAPLIIAEGDADDKRSAISASDYLSFAYEAFSRYRGPLVIFGSDLGDSDNHLVEAMRPVKGRRLAVSVYGTVGEQKWTMARFERLFGGAEISYFYADTHPLGANGLRIN